MSVRELRGDMRVWHQTCSVLMTSSEHHSLNIQVSVEQIIFLQLNSIHKYFNPLKPQQFTDNIKLYSLEQAHETSQFPLSYVTAALNTVTTLFILSPSSWEKGQLLMHICKKPQRRVNILVKLTAFPPTVRVLSLETLSTHPYRNICLQTTSPHWQLHTFFNLEVLQETELHSKGFLLKHKIILSFIYLSLSDVISGCKLYWRESGLRQIVEVNSLLSSLLSSSLCPVDYPLPFFPKWISISFHFSLFTLFSSPFSLCCAALHYFNQMLLKGREIRHAPEK